MALINGESDLNELLQAQSHIWKHSFNFMNFMSLKCALELGIPDIIHCHGQPMTLPEQIAALPIIHSTKAHHLSLLMSLLVQSGFFAVKKVGGDNHNQEACLLTLASHLLLKDNPFSERPFAFAVLDPVLIQGWHCMSTWFKNDDLTPFSTASGETFLDKLSREPRVNSFFIEAMATDSMLDSRVVISRCKEVFQGLNSLVDVRGDTGNMTKVIAEAFPNLDCILLDLPHVVAGLQGSKKLKFFAGYMFVAIPPANAVLLKLVLHDWNDQECIKILKHCKVAITSKGEGRKLIIIDVVLGSQIMDKDSIEVQLFCDLEMMVNLSGKERNEAELAKLFFDAGFSNYKIYPVLGIRSLIEWLLHDWNGKECIKILGHCKVAITSKAEGGKLIIIDMVLGSQIMDKDSIEVQHFYDLRMMIHVTGKERNETEWAKLFFDAGFSNYKRYPVVGLRSH